MIIILNDDAVYLSWIRRHHNGFVLDTRRKATKRNTLLHRASCDEVKHSKTKRTHWTTGARVKACSENCDELMEWAAQQMGREPNACRLCVPLREPAEVPIKPQSVDHSLTRLENDIVAAVIESAVIHLDNDLGFSMTVGDVAEYLSKTPVQISTSLRQLVAAQMLELETELGGGGPISTDVRVYPTAASLCTVPAFAALDRDELQQELNMLHS